MVKDGVLGFSLLGQGIEGKLGDIEAFHGNLLRRLRVFSGGYHASLTASWRHETFEQHLKAMRIVKCLWLSASTTLLHAGLLLYGSILDLYCMPSHVIGAGDRGIYLVWGEGYKSTPGSLVLFIYCCFTPCTAILCTYRNLCLCWRWTGSLGYCGV